VLQSNGGLPAEAVVCFANTGKEDEATLRFVQECSERWGIPISWIEYQSAEETKDRFKVVTFETASRSGEPFETLIKDRRFLPNPVARFCTVELKVRAFHRFLRSIGWTEWDAMLGIRADEPRRLAKIGNQDYGKHEQKVAPLGRAGVTKEVVGEFWRNQPFDLGLPNMNGVTVHGNCDLCFLKTTGVLASLVSERPERAIWWARMEQYAEGLATNPRAARFHMDRPSYAGMAAFAAAQGEMFDHDEEAMACFCGD